MIQGKLGPIHCRRDNDFYSLVQLTASKELKLRRQTMGVGYALTYPDGNKIIFKSYAKLKLEIENYNGLSAA